MVCVAGFVDEEGGRSVDIEDDEIQIAVVVDVAECGAAAGLEGSDVEARRVGDVLEE